MYVAELRSRLAHQTCRSGTVVAVSGFLVHGVEGHPTRLHGSSQRGAQCLVDSEEGQHGKVRSAVDSASGDVDRRIETRAFGDIMLFSDFGLSLAHHYNIHRFGLPHVTFRRDYMARLRALLPVPTVLPLNTVPPSGAQADVSPRPARRTHRQVRPVHVMTESVGDLPVLTLIHKHVRSCRELRANCQISQTGLISASKLWTAAHQSAGRILVRMSSVTLSSHVFT